MEQTAALSFMQIIYRNDSIFSHFAEFIETGTDVDKVAVDKHERQSESVRYGYFDLKLASD